MHSGAIIRKKPHCQVDWDAQVHSVAKTIATNESKTDLRPRLFDKLSGTSILLDTGACCSIWPKEHFQNLTLDESKKFQAVNGTHIDTFGERMVKIRVGNMEYHHKVIPASISEAILGWDYLVRFRLDLKWAKNGKKCFLDDPGGQSVQLKLDACNKNNLSLALVTFKQFSYNKVNRQPKQRNHT